MYERWKATAITVRKGNSLFSVKGLFSIELNPCIDMRLCSQSFDSSASYNRRRWYWFSLLQSVLRFLVFQMNVSMLEVQETNKKCQYNISRKFFFENESFSCEVFCGDAHKYSHFVLKILVLSGLWHISSRTLKKCVCLLHT